MKDVSYDYYYNEIMKKYPEWLERGFPKDFMREHCLAASLGWIEFMAYSDDTPQEQIEHIKEIIKAKRCCFRFH